MNPETVLVTRGEVFPNPLRRPLRQLGFGRAIGAGQTTTTTSGANLAGHTLTGMLGGAVAGAVVGWLIKKPVESVAIGAGVGGVASFLLNK